MPHIFISYAKKDTRELAEALHKALVRISGTTAWMDRVLEPDESWAAQIMEEIDACDYFVVLLSPDVNRQVTPVQRRSFVLNEIDYVQQLEQHKPILPVMVIKTKMPIQIAGIQYIDLTDSPTDPTRVVERVRIRFGLPMRSVTQDRKVEVRRLLRRGRQKLEWGSHDDAIADFSAAIQLDPSDPSTLLERARVRSTYQDYTGAIEDYSSILELDPDNIEALSERGNAKMELDDIDGAIEDFDAALYLDPMDSVVYEQRSLAKELLGDLEGSIVDLDAASQLSPQDDSYYEVRGELKQRIGDLAGAIADFDYLISRMPQSSFAFALRGNARLKSGDYEGAISDFEEALRITPDDDVTGGLRDEALAKINGKDSR